MNTYLLKLAEIIINKDKSLPYRRRVEVAIFKGDKVLITKHRDAKTGSEWYGFPGGGTDGDTDEVAAKKECLEEVGVLIGNISKTPLFNVSEGIPNKDGRAEKYRGTKTRYYTAMHDGKNSRLLEEDSPKFLWADKAEALKLLSKNKVDPTHRIKLLKNHWPE